MTELSGRELDRAVCVALGWLLRSDDTEYVYAPGELYRRPMPVFSSSLDSCFGPNGITRWLKAHGSTWSISDGGWKPLATIERFDHAYEILIERYDESAATAFCRAFLQVVDFFQEETKK